MEATGRFAKNRLKFKNFAIAIEPVRSRRHPSRRRTTRWRIFPLHTLQLNGMQVEKLAFKSFTDSPILGKNATSAIRYRFVCVSTFFRVLEPVETKIS